MSLKTWSYTQVFSLMLCINYTSDYPVYKFNLLKICIYLWIYYINFKNKTSKSVTWQKPSYKKYIYTHTRGLRWSFFLKWFLKVTAFLDPKYVSFGWIGTRLELFVSWMFARTELTWKTIWTYVFSWWEYI